MRRHGAHVLVSDIADAKGEAFAAGLRSAGQKADYVHCDVAVEADVAGLIAHAVKSAGRLDALVNNAAISIRGMPVYEMTDAQWHRLIAVNLTSVFRSCKFALPHMIAQKSGSIINMASAQGHIGLDGWTAYAGAGNLCSGRRTAGQPMHIAPWAGEPGTEGLPGILRKLRGDWPCAPFGYTAPVSDAPPEWAPFLAPPEAGEEVHGYCADRDWDWDAASDGSLALALDYPAASPVRRVERIVTPDPGRPAVGLTFRMHIPETCRLPLGLHPVFRLPAAPRAAKLEPGRFDHGRTYPGSIEPSAPFFAIDQRFADLAAVPLRTGGTFDASRLPLAGDVEELSQLNGIGDCALANSDGGYRVKLTWQKERFPNLLLRFSNRGRKLTPWNGRHVAIGINPVCSPFGLGPATALADNPVARSDQRD